MNTLSSRDIAVLAAFFDECGGGVNCHPSIHAIKKHLPIKLKNNLKDVKKSIKKLIKLGYLSNHPTSGEKTYDLTKDGRDYILKL